MDRHSQRMAAQAARSEHARKAKTELYNRLAAAVDDDAWRKLIAGDYVDWLLTQAHWRPPPVRPDTAPVPAKRPPDPPPDTYLAARRALRGRTEETP